MCMIYGKFKSDDNKAKSEVSFENKAGKFKKQGSKKEKNSQLKQQAESALRNSRALLNANQTEAVTKMNETGGFKDEQTIKFTFDGKSQGVAVEETANYGNTNMNQSITGYSKENSQQFNSLKQHDSQRDYPTQPLENSIDLEDRNDALNTVPDRDADV